MTGFGHLQRRFKSTRVQKFKVIVILFVLADGIRIVRIDTEVTKDFVENVTELLGTSGLTSRFAAGTNFGIRETETRATSISITCIDRDGIIVKRVTSTDDAEVKDPENDNPDNTGDNSGQQTPSGNQTQGSGDSTQGGNQSQTPPANNQGGGTQTGGDDEGGVGEY